MTLAPDDWRHGTTGGYTNHGCRCGACREASRRSVARWRASTPPLEPDDARHGTVNGYQNHGCRCARCKRAAQQAGRASRHSTPHT